jgi:hypothetical protein
MLPGASWSESGSRSSQRSACLKSDMKHRFTIDMAPLKSE